MENITNRITPRFLLSAGVVLSLMLITLVTTQFGIAYGVIMFISPFAAIALFYIIKQPFWGLVSILTISYFIIPAIRYSNAGGLSVFIDIFTILTVISMMLNAIYCNKKYDFSSAYNGLTFVSVIWMIFCIFCVANPSSTLNAWFVSRGMTYYMFATVMISFLIFSEIKYVYKILYILSFLTLIGIAKGFMQKYIGFDYGDLAFLASGASKTHLLASGTRYFSIYASAGIYGVVMGHAAVVFGICAIYMEKRWTKIYFIIVALLALYSMIMSGTRGAMAVPGVAIVMYILLSKRLKIIIPTFVIMLVSYIFLAHTTIGQGNSEIRRMRSVFNPNEPSLMVRKENQKLFREYLKDKPFGEGLGLSGVEAQNLSVRFTTTVPTDSWYVKIWVETGIVGLIIHLASLIYILIHGAYILLFKVHNKKLQGILSALLCGVAGILVSSYGNLVLGQFPVVTITYMSMALVFMGPYLDKKLERTE